MDKEKEDYVAKLVQLINECMRDKTKHGVLIVGDEETRSMAMLSINADDEEIGRLVTAAATYCVEDMQNPERTVN